MDSVKHIVRYGTHAEKKYIDNKDFYFDLLAFNGNMLAFTPGAIAEFIMMNLLDSDSSKGFFIDPITHAFQHDLSKIKSYSKKEKKYTLKKSIENLINYYGEPLVNKIINKNQSVVPQDFNNNESNEEFCKNVVSFQLDTIKRQLEEKDFLEYIPENAEILKNLEPDFIIAPYFFMTESTYESWLPINIDLLKIVKKTYTDKKVFAQIVVSKDIFMSSSFFENVCNLYVEGNPDGILLWIDDFDEHEASKTQLSKFVELIKQFSTKGITVYNLYGGYFSITLTGLKQELGYSLDGVGHGLEYGEHRAVVPVGGGIPTSKYYYYSLHNRLKYVEATQLLETQGYFNRQINSNQEAAKRYYDEICNCQLCHEIIKNDIDNFSAFENTEFYEVKIKGVKQRRSYPDEETKRACLVHYLLKKKKEFIEVQNKNLDYIIQNLKNNYDKYLEMGVLNWDALIYLQNWYSVLDKCKREGLDSVE